MKKSLLVGVLAIAILLVGAVTYATADTVTYYGTGSPSSVDGTVTVSCVVNPMIELDITTPDPAQTVDFGTVDPGDVCPQETVSLTVRSNGIYDLTKTTNDPDSIGFTTDLANQLNQPVTSGQAYTDNYDLTVPWTLTPGAHSGSVVYSAVQQ